MNISNGVKITCIYDVLTFNFSITSANRQLGIIDTNQSIIVYYISLHAVYMVPFIRYPITTYGGIHPWRYSSTTNMCTTTNNTSNPHIGNGFKIHLICYNIKIEIFFVLP